MEKSIIQKAGRLYSIAERHQIINEYLSGDYTKQQIWQKYTGDKEEHGQLLHWLRRLGYEDKKERFKPTTFASIEFPMRNKTIEKAENSSDIDFEKLQLEKRVLELEKQLKEAQMKAVAFSTMVDIAEKEFKIPIRKKYNTKP